MKEEIEVKLAEVSKLPQWKLLKHILKEEIDKICDLENIETFEEMVGAKFCKRVFEEFVRKVDGAEDALTFRK